jgi:hypothetical protein
VALVLAAILVIGAALITMGSSWRAGFVVVVVVGLVIGALFLLRNSLRSYPCDASGAVPRCGPVSNAPGP